MALNWLRWCSNLRICGCIRGARVVAAAHEQMAPQRVRVVAGNGTFPVFVNPDTTIAVLRQRVQEWYPDYSPEQIELVCDAGWDAHMGWWTASCPRADDETVEALSRHQPGRVLHIAIWIKEKNQESGEWESMFWKTQVQLWTEEAHERAAAAARDLAVRVDASRADTGARDSTRTRTIVQV